jgi:hypothetical protein
MHTSAAGTAERPAGSIAGKTWLGSGRGVAIWTVGGRCCLGSVARLEVRDRSLGKLDPKLQEVALPSNSRPPCE